MISDASGERLGIAHRDLSLENILLSGLVGLAQFSQMPGGESEQVKLIDFGMAHVGRMCPAATTLGPGKPSYQAPELHEKRDYDGFKADAFSLGVVVYAMAMGNYPWQSTKPGRSRIFDWVHGHGVLPFLQRQEIAGLPFVLIGWRCEAGYFSEELIELIAALLHIQPAQRLGLVQSGCQEPSHMSFLNEEWLKGHRMFLPFLTDRRSITLAGAGDLGVQVGCSSNHARRPVGH